jgi:hypothetical protein
MHGNGDHLLHSPSRFPLLESSVVGREYAPLCVQARLQGRLRVFYRNADQDTRHSTQSTCNVGEF